MSPRRFALGVTLALLGAPVALAGSPVVAAVTVGPGVIFQPSASWANVSFATTHTFSGIRVDATGVTFDAVRFGVVKLPSSLPRAEVVISTWTPLQTVVDGTVVRFTGDAPSGSTLHFGLSNVTPAREYILRVDGTERDRRFSDVAGSVTFAWANWSLHDFHVLFGSQTGTPPPPSPLSANFTFAPSSPATGESVTFSAAASGGTPPYAFAWDFGDGSSGSGSSVAHAYGFGGSYGVTVTATDAVGQVASGTKTVSVAAAPPPPPTLSANFTFSPPAPVAGESVTFSAAAAGGSAPYTYAWDFGDGGMGQGVTATHAYASQGVYTAILVVEDSVGDTVTVSSPIPVGAAPPPSGPANVTAAFDYVVNDRTVTFIDRSTSDGALPISSYYWAFGDGTSSRESRPTHTYSVSGLMATYSVVLVACDSANRCGSTAREITLYNWPLLLALIGGSAAAAALGVVLAVRRRRRRSDEVRRGRRERVA